MGYEIIQDGSVRRRKKHRLITIGVALFCIAALSTGILAYKLNFIEHDGIRTGGDVIVLSPSLSPGLPSAINNLESDSDPNSAPQENPFAAGYAGESAGGDSGLDIVEGDGVSWSQLEELNIFSNPQYGGDKIIVPGSHGSYFFTLVNRSENTLACALTFSETNDYNVAMKYRLRTAQEYIFGDEDNWITAEGLAEVDSSIYVNSQQEYILDWMWIYEDGTEEVDQHDTSIGNSAYGEEVPYILEMNVTAQWDGLKPPGVDSPETGDAGGFMTILAVLCSSMVVIVFLALGKRRRKEAQPVSEREIK